MSLLVAPALIRVVEAEELSEFLGLEDSPENDKLLTLLLAAAVDKIESRTHRLLISRAVTEERRIWGHLCDVRLQRAPLVSMTTVHIDDEEVFLIDDDEVTTGFEVDVDGATIHYDPQLDSGAKTRIVYVAGYGSTPADVPEALRVGVLRTAATLFEHREDVQVGTISGALPLEVTAIVAPYVRMFL